MYWIQTDSYGQSISNLQGKGKNRMAKANGKMIANNKKAYHDYFILENFETGIALHGTEV